MGEENIDHIWPIRRQGGVGGGTLTGARRGWEAGESGGQEFGETANRFNDQGDYRLVKMGGFHGHKGGGEKG